MLPLVLVLIKGSHSFPIDNVVRISPLSVMLPQHSLIGSVCLFYGLTFDSRRSYHYKINLYEIFCRSISRSPYPAEQDSLIFFIIERFLHHIKYSTIRGDLSAILSAHTDRGISSPFYTCSALQRILRGIRRIQGETNDNRRAITAPVMRKFFRQLSNCSHFDTVVVRAAFLVALSGLLRISEFAYSSQIDRIKMLRVSNIVFYHQSQPPYAKLRLLASKSDFFRKGVTILIPCTCPDICPFHEVENMFQLRRANGYSCAINDPLFQLSDGSVLKRCTILAILEKLVTACNLPGRYSGHSFRKGGASSLAAAGAPDWAIKVLGRWSIEAYDRYMRLEIEDLLIFARLVMAHH